MTGRAPGQVSSQDQPLIYQEAQTIPTAAATTATAAVATTTATTRFTREQQSQDDGSASSCQSEPGLRGANNKVS